MKNYEAISIEVINLEVADVITTSGFDGETDEFAPEV